MWKASGIRVTVRPTCRAWGRGVRAGWRGEVQEPHVSRLVGTPGPAPADFLLAWAPDRSLRIPSGFDPGELRRLLDVLGVRP